MFTLAGAGSIFFRNSRNNTFNILLVSAFILLCFDPFLITDVGFLLSYFAIFGIIFFVPWFEKIWQPSNMILNAVWKNVAASFAATLSTLPFTLLFFNQFPLWFFVCNLIVVPLSFTALLLSLLLVLHIPKLAVLINFLISFMTWFIGLFNASGAGFIDNIHFTLFDSILLSLLIIFISAALYYRSYRFAFTSLLLVITWQISGIIISYKAKTGNCFTVYQIRKNTICSVKNGVEVTVSPHSEKLYNYHVRPHVISFNYPDTIPRAFNAIDAGNEHVLILDHEDHWPLVDYEKVSTLVICSNFTLREQDLPKFNALHTIVADGSNNRRSIDKLKILCAKFGIGFYDTSERGAYIAKL
jgi:competence protein ComEC